MTLRLARYSTYRGSGIPWLGLIPGHWEVRRNGLLFDRRQEGGSPELPLLEVSLKTGVRVRNLDGSGRKQAMVDRAGYQRANAGDIAYNMMRMWQGALGIVPEDGLVSPAYVVAIPRPEADAGFYAYLFRTGAYMDEVDNYSRGIVKDRNRLYWVDFKRMPSVFPPTGEQQQISAFLGHFDRRINRLSRSKQRLIGLLEEQKQAIVYRTVTRGIDRSVRLKPAGKGCFFEVPEHWMATRLKFVASIQTGLTLGKDYGSTPLVERPYLRVANVQPGKLSLSNVKTVRVPVSEAASTTLREGDVLMTEGGDIDKLGRGCVWGGEIPGCLHQNHVFAVRPRLALLLPDFLVAAMTSKYGRSYFETTAKQTTNLASTNSTTLGCFPLFVPEVIEQQAILDWLSGETRGIDCAIERTEREIALLREYRTRLITDVVTGQLDVRGVSLPPLPDSDAEDPDAELDDSDDADLLEAAETLDEE